MPFTNHLTEDFCNHDLYRTMTSKPINKRYGITIFIVIASLMLTNLPICAQSSDEPYPVTETTFERTDAQKGVATSTDVLVIAMPVATLAGVLLTKDWEGLKQGALTASVTTAATLLLKYTVKEKRPDGSNYHSFPSGHSAISFATAAFLQRRYGWKFGIPAYALSAYVAWGRVYSKKHHWWDVVGGAAIGAGSAYIFTRPWAKKHELTISPIATTEAMGVYASFKF